MRAYFKLNLGKEVSIQKVWDAFKAVIRGILMKMEYEYKEQRKRNSRHTIKESESIKNPKIGKLRDELKIYQNRLQNILQEKILKNEKFVKQNFYGSQ